MTVSGILLLVGFALFAALMVVRVLQTLLALPLMAGWIAFVCGIPFVEWLDEILLKGSFRLSMPIAPVIFGSMFAKVIQKTGISDAIIKKAAELSGDKPIAIAILMTAATAFIFLGMMTGSSLNFAGQAAGIGIFGSEAVLRYFVPGAIVSLTVTVAYIVINIPRGEGSGSSMLALLKETVDAH